MSSVSDFGSNGKTMFRDLSTGFLPITIVVVIVAAFFWAGFGYSKLTSNTEQADTRISLVTLALEEQKNAIKELVTQIADLRRTIGAIPQDAMRERDFAAHMAGFCLKFERLNRGTRCPAEM